MSITQKDTKLLWGRAGSRCTACRVELSHDAVNKPNSYLLGEQAHIVGESQDAPRGKSSLTVEERNTYHNLILLCPNHHTEFDKSESDWPIEKLYQLKSGWMIAKSGFVLRQNLPTGLPTLCVEISTQCSLPRKVDLLSLRTLFESRLSKT